MNNLPLVPAPIVTILDWEGQALNEPAPPAFKPDPVAQTALDVADAIASTVLGNGESSLPEQEIVSFLAAWRERYGNEKFADLKKQVHAENDKQRLTPPQNEALRCAVDQMFDHACA